MKPEKGVIEYIDNGGDGVINTPSGKKAFHVRCFSLLVLTPEGFIISPERKKLKGFRLCKGLPVLFITRGVRIFRFVVIVQEDEVRIWHGANKIFDGKRNKLLPMLLDQKFSPQKCHAEIRKEGEWKYAFLSDLVAA